MKKFLVVAFAFVLTAASVCPVSALEHVMGGYWRTRAVTQQNFSGDSKDESRDITQVDTRTRIYYTAKINDELSFVNKFEFNTVWGDNDGGDIGTDGTDDFRIKHSYFRYLGGDFDISIGMQPLVVQRGFFFDDDFAGAIVTYKRGGLRVPFAWVRIDEGHVDFEGEKDADDHDFDYYLLNPEYSFPASSFYKSGVFDAVTVKGLLAYAFRDKNKKDKTTELLFLGVDLDVEFKNDASLWFTGIYETGEYKDDDIDAFLLALGGDCPLGKSDLLGTLRIHGEAFFASGDDDGDDIREFKVPEGQDYAWAEIMGEGMFDEGVTAGSPGDEPADILAFNVGVSAKPTKKLKLKADIWYARLHEEDKYGNDELGVEVDLKATYKLLPGLNLDIVAAYLFAGDATSKIGDNSEDPFEIGTRLKFAF